MATRRRKPNAKVVVPAALALVLVLLTLFLPWYVGTVSFHWASSNRTQTHRTFFYLDHSTGSVEMSYANSVYHEMYTIQQRMYVLLGSMIVSALALLVLILAEKWPVASLAGSFSAIVGVLASVTYGLEIGTGVGAPGNPRTFWGSYTSGPFFGDVFETDSWGPYVGFFILILAVLVLLVSVSLCTREIANKRGLEKT